jgi:hypothetical protein
MKKAILSIATMLMTSGLSMAQFTFTPNTTSPTGMAFTGNTLPASTDHGQFYEYQAYNGSGSNYNGTPCTTPTSGLGGFDAGGVQSATGGVGYYGGGIATVYFDETWGTCVPHIPSFGFYTGTGTGGVASGYSVDLSNAANQVIKFTYTSNVAMNLTLQFFDVNYAGLTNGKTFSVIAGTQTLTINFSDVVPAGGNMTGVRQISFLYDNVTPSPAFQLVIGDIQLGSAVVTGIANSTAVANSNIFPNPSTGITTISGDLKSVSNVKIVLVDMLGQEVKVITETTTNSINASFDVSALNKGIYSVVYYIDGAPAKSQKLVVR